MTCPSDAVLIALLEHGLGGADVGRLELHVDRCSRCRALVGHLATVGSTLDGLPDRLPDSLIDAADATTDRTASSGGSNPTRG